MYYYSPHIMSSQITGTEGRAEEGEAVYTTVGVDDKVDGIWEDEMVGAAYGAIEDGPADGAIEDGLADGAIEDGPADGAI